MVKNLPCELSLMVCDNLEGWDGVGGGREDPEGGDTCISMADSRYTTETNTTLIKQLSSNEKSIKVNIIKYNNNNRRIHLAMQGTKLRSLVRELRSHVQWGN